MVMRPTGTIMAPPMPWMTRQATSMLMSTARPHSSEPSGEQPDRRGEDAARAEAVGHPAADRDEDREAERVARQHRLHVERRDVHRLRDGRHRRVEDGGVERLHEEGHRDQPGQQSLGRLGRWRGRARSQRCSTSLVRSCTKKQDRSGRAPPPSPSAVPSRAASADSRRLGNRRRPEAPADRKRKRRRMPPLVRPPPPAIKVRWRFRRRLAPA